MRFSLSTDSIDVPLLREELLDVEAGGFCSFEGWVRNHHLGKGVVSLDYETYGALAVKQGNAVVAEALDKFDIMDVRVVHRTGSLSPGDLAIWIGVTAAHRAAAFEACRFLIDIIKDSVPIWKHEFYKDGTDAWVDPTDCSCAQAHHPE
jgi:molybdopterin synthase catalytic subunit